MEDGSHPTAAGSYLAACVFFATLFDQRPVGTAVSDRLKIDRDTGAKLQAFAWAFRADG
jgi:nitrate/nitrite transporter NarK